MDSLREEGPRSAPRMMGAYLHASLNASEYPMAHCPAT